MINMTQELWLEISEREKPIGVGSFLAQMRVNRLQYMYRTMNYSYPVSGDD